jgi:hypothetical protein
MARPCLLRGGLLGLVLITGLAVMAIYRPPDRGPVYTVAQVQAGLADQPQDWVGRTVQVRGMVEPCPLREGTAILWRCPDDPLILVPTAADRVAEPLPLSRVTLDGIPAILHGLPLLQDLVATPWAVPQFTPARFLVRLRSKAVQACSGRSPCYEAVLLDAASDGPQG